MQERPYHTITASVSEHIATITLNLPERKNPIGPLMVNELLWALEDAAADDDVRVVVLTGAGGAFSAGGDLKQLSGADDAPTVTPKGDFSDLLLSFTKLGKPSVAKVNGVAMGGGLGLVASCDFAVAGHTAILGTPEIRRGLFPMMIMAVLQRVVPRRKLKEMMLLGDKLSADKALEYGLISHVCPTEELDQAVDDLASRLAAQSPTAMRLGLQAFHAQADEDLATAVPSLQQRFFGLLGTEDAREGLRAFVERRPPQWTGK